jgi:hypothetical protein
MHLPLSITCIHREKKREIEREKAKKGKEREKTEAKVTYFVTNAPLPCRILNVTQARRPSLL